MTRTLMLSPCLTRLLLTAALLSASAVEAGNWGVNVYGLSYHWDRDQARQNDWDKEFNPGLGVRYQLGSWLKADAILDAGAYYDSGRNTAVYAAAGLLWPLDRDKRFNLGVAITAFHSDTYNQGDPFIAPIPLFALRFDRVVVNLTHFPKVGNLNEIHTTAMFLTFPLR
ncbi:MAG: hypothetical protein Q8S10_13085 [Thiobacillus sp.]|nr:hypothetical protein [Thiobacillus sp.]